MPIYEYYSKDTHSIYQFYCRSVSQANCVPKCPDNPDYTMKRMVSLFNPAGLTRKSRKEGGGADGDIDDPRMMQAMAEMEREMAGMDEENPDPRKLANLMRRMSSLTGEALPEDMEEMIGRMEAGEDLEALEEEFGDMDMGMDDDMPGSAGEGPEGATGEADEPSGNDSTATAAPSKTLQERIALLRKAKGEPPRRIEKIYEMDDYL